MIVLASPLMDKISVLAFQNNINTSSVMYNAKIMGCRQAAKQEGSHGK
jgi:hypothetical protein